MEVLSASLDDFWVRFLGPSASKTGDLDQELEALEALEASDTSESTSYTGDPENKRGRYFPP